MSCVAIHIVNTNNIPDHLKGSDGKVYLDTREDFDVISQRQSEQLNILGNIQAGGSYPINLPDTELNRIVLYDKVSPNNINRDGNPILVDIIGDGELSQHHDLFVIEFNEQSCLYNCEIRLNPKDHWLPCLSELPLCELDFGDFLYTLQNVWDNQENNCIYQDGDQGITFPDVYYGGFVDSQAVTVRDYRPLFHVLAVLQKMFCHCGWTFRSPIFESEEWRKRAIYIINKHFEDRGAFLEAEKFSASISAPYISPDANLIPERKIKFDLINFDNGGNYNSSNYSYSNIGTEECFCVDLTLRTTEPGVEVIGDILIYGGGGIAATHQVRLNNTPQNVSFCSNRITVPDNTDISVGFQQIQGGVIGGSNAVGFVEFISGTFYNDVKRKLLTPGDVIQANTLIDCEYLGIDFLKGILHFIGEGRIDTNFNTRVVTVFPAYGVKDDDDNDVEGYYKSDSEIIDISEFIRCESVKLSNKSRDTERSCDLTFAKSNDAFIRDKYLDDEEPMSHTIDFGESFTGKKTSKPNPFFESTEMGIVSYPYIFDGVDYGTNRMHVAHLVDNLDGEVSYDIGPRILSVECFADVKDPDSSQSHVHTHRIGNMGGNRVGYAYAHSYGKWLIDGDVPKAFTGYGGQDNGFGKRYWERLLFSQKFASVIDFKTCMSSGQVSFLNFRNRYMVITKDDTYIFNLTSIGGISYCGGADGNIVGQTEVPFALCAESNGGEDDGCSDQILTLEQTGDYTFQSQGTITGTLNYEIFEWKHLDEAQFTAFTGSINPTRDFIVRLRYQIDDCPEKSDTLIVRICPDETNIISHQYDPLTDEVTLIPEGTFTNVDTDTIIWSDTVPCDDPNFETAAMAYTGPFTVTNGTTIYYARRISFTNDCEDLYQCESEMFPPITVDCEDIDASIECIRNNGMVTLNPIGYAGENILIDLIQYREIGNQEWIEWDGTPIPCPIEARRAIIYCENNCPPYCSDVVTCGCDDCNLTLNIICVNKILTVSGAPIGATIMWTGPNNYTHNGNGAMVNDDGLYTVTVTDNNVSPPCTDTATYQFTKPNAGTPVSNPIIV